jgi:hypothetical protein
MLIKKAKPNLSVRSPSSQRTSLRIEPKELPIVFLKAVSGQETSRSDFSGSTFSVKSRNVSLISRKNHVKAHEQP